MFRNWKPVIGLLPWPIRNCQLRNTPEHFFHSSTSSKFIITDLDSLFDSLEKTSESDDEWRMSRFKTIKMLSKWFSKRCQNFQKQSIKFQNRPELVSDGLNSFYHLIFINQQKRTLFLNRPDSDGPSRTNKISRIVSLYPKVTFWWKIINFLCARESGESYMKGKISNCINDPISGNATIKAVGSKPPTLRRVFIVSFTGYSEPFQKYSVY